MLVRDIFEIMYEKQKLPVASVYTVLGRLIKRGLVERRQVDRIFHYHPLIQKKDLGRFGVIKDDRYRPRETSLISRLVREEISSDPKELERLQKILDQERKRLRKEQ